MFKYDNSGKQSKPKEKQVKHIAQVRKVTYINPNPDKKKAKEVPFIHTEGWEIVKEIVADPTIPLTMTPDVVDHKTVEFKPRIVRKKKNPLEEKANGSD